MRLFSFLLIFYCLSFLYARQAIEEKRTFTIPLTDALVQQNPAVKDDLTRSRLFSCETTAVKSVLSPHFVVFHPIQKLHLCRL